jgi:hypothetical protein
VIDDVRAAATALRVGGPPDEGELPTLELGGRAPAYLGLDDEGRLHLLLELAAESDHHVTEVSALDIRSRRLSIAGRAVHVLDITNLVGALAEVFDHLVVAILERVAVTPETPAAATRFVLERWRAFLTPSSAPPGREKLAGLIGELLFLRDVLAADPTRRIDAWVGPFGARHDFRRGDSAVEVKTTQAHTSHRVAINGEDQLLAPEHGTLHLHFVRLEPVPDGGLSVAGLMDELLASGAAAERLFEAVTASGIALTDIAATSDVTFDERERLTFAVYDDFPRIVPASFAGGARPEGVDDLVYSIDLAAQLDAALSQDAFANLVGQLGGAG